MTLKMCNLLQWLLKGPQQPHPPLFQLRSFWATVLLPVGLAFVVTFFIAQSLSFPDMELTKKGFDNAYDYFKIPLWIAALSLPLAGFYASHHRSVQTAVQIARSDIQILSTQSKNNFENYIKHLDYFSAQIEHFESLHNIKISDPIKLYRKIFPINDYSDFSPWADDMKFIEYIGERSDIPLEFNNYLDYIRHYIVEMSSSKDIVSELKGDIFSNLDSIFTLLLIKKIDDINIWDFNVKDKYYFLDGEIYLPALTDSIDRVVNLFFSIESMCLSRDYFEKIGGGNRFTEGDLFMFLMEIRRVKENIKALTEQSNLNGVAIKETIRKGRKDKEKRWKEQISRLKA